ncbi:hypothetical protein DFH28DRAFT_1018325 [Melampsora americana]|nr:hypothetical protein DFH28DRAFT_1018325 [Melampsora americana]
MSFSFWLFTLCSITLGALRIPQWGSHASIIRDIREEYTLVSPTEEIRDHLADGLEWIQLEREDKTQRLKAIEIFETSENNIRHNPVSTAWSKITGALEKYILILPDISDLVHLTHTTPTGRESLKRLLKSIRGVIKWFHQVIELWDEGSPLDKAVLIALETLQENNLTAPERLWVLRVFQSLQSYLPRRNLKPVRLDPYAGPVCRGALELFLTEGRIWMTRGVKSPSNDKISALAISEPLERTELIVKIRDYFGDLKKANLSVNFMKIYDSLLQTKGASVKKEFVGLTLRCMHHMAIEYTPRKEKESVFHILNHLSKFSEDCKKNIQCHVTNDDHIRRIYQSLSNNFKYQSELRPRIQKYLSGEDVDPYIGNLLLPFLGVSLVTMDHIKHVVTCLKFQQYVLANRKAAIYGLDPSKTHQYNRDQHFVIETLYLASSSIKGSIEFLNSELKIHGKSLNLHLELIHSFPPGNTDPSSLPLEEENHDLCPICYDEFSRGQRVIKLNCFTPHKFHAQCMDSLVMVSKAKSKDLLCPSCRRYLHLPIPISQHNIE